MNAEETRRARHAVEVVPDPASVATRAAEWLIGQIAHAVAKRGRAVIALSGGSTPRALYERLALHPWCDRVAWEAVHVFWGDERFVGARDDASNAKMAKDALLDQVALPAAHVYRIPPDLTPAVGDVESKLVRAQDAAALYATSLHAFYGGTQLADERPFFDVVLMGLGDDGHTASLFPDSPALDERDRWVVATRKDDDAAAPVRITLTYPVLESAHAMLFLVEGAAKTTVLRRALDGDAALPAARVRPVGGTLWIVDQAAADLPSVQADHPRHT